ncbi:MAG TPA: FAD-dependent oxidoreductase [Thermoflexia bacterium]|nr:FAD-dependent oxidoreductase [Thermoflexia bacterium]
MKEKQTLNNPTNQLPTHAQVVIIGGGVIGCSVAYHLTKLGWRDVVLLERKDLTCGTTWHAAGLVESSMFDSAVKNDMAKYTQELYQKLGEETGQDTGFRRVGYLELASSKEYLEGFRRAADFGRYYGHVIEELSPSEIKKMWPLLKTDDLLAGFYCPDDARVNPVDVTMALAKGARMGGARIFEDTKVTGIKQKNGRVTGVVTEKGEIEAEYVVNCGGMWAREVGQMAGVHVPLHAAEHYYLITEPIDGIHRDLPIVDDSARFAYYREETGGLMIGLFEPVAAPWGHKGIPETFKFDELAPDWDRMIPHLELAMERIPVAKTAGVHKFFCGPESFTPDLESLMGEAPNLKNYYVAAGFNSLGILLGGGVGQVMAQWIVDGLPPIDICDVDIARMLPFQNNPRYLRDRTVELLGLMYAQSYHNLQNEMARNARKSPFHDRLAEAGAWFGAYAGWEYPDWFAPEGVEPKVEYTWGRQNWFEYAAAEHRAAREGVTLMDYSVMGKLLVQGRDAEKALNRICANNMVVPIGRCVYTQWLNERGRIEADLTVTRLAEDQYLVLTGDATITAVQAWLKRNIPPDAHVCVTNITSAYSVLNVQGPKSRDLLSRVTNADMSNEAFPFLTLQEIDIGYALVLALRVSYVGELGWELYIPTEFSLHVFDTLVEAGQDVGLVFAGLQALETLRLEKAYRDYGNDVDNLDTPLEVGLSRFVDFDKPGGFIGKEALLRHKEAGVKHRLVQFLLEDPEPLLYYNEIIYRDGEPVGRILAGGYGHTLGASVGLGYVENEEGVTADYVKSGMYEIQVAGVRYPAKASLRPMYDPKLERVRS